MTGKCEIILKLSVWAKIIFKKKLKICYLFRKNPADGSCFFTFYSAPFWVMRPNIRLAGNNGWNQITNLIADSIGTGGKRQMPRYRLLLFPSSSAPERHFYTLNMDLVSTCVVYTYPYVFGPPGSGSVSPRYGSGNFYHHAKMVRKTLIPTVLWLLYDLLSLKNDVNVPSKSKEKNLEKNGFWLAFWRSRTKLAGSGDGCGSIGQRQGSADPDPYQNVMDPQHW